MFKQFHEKRISDPIYGSIGISKLEADIISTRPFLRLRNIQQLGLAHYVFPSAGYSRFSHSLGVCHITGKILNSLSMLPGEELTEDEVRLYRLAGLLHDIGHYPFSHAMEHAIENFYSAAMFVESNGQADDCQPDHSANVEAYYKHERLGKEILENDDELQSIFSKNGIVAKDVYAIFNREQPPRFANLVSSDLDADRIDYLSRTARHTGLPYGNVDLEYLISQMRIDSNSRICLSQKALRTADHFLLSRYFDYQQVSFHKSVAAFELVLKDVLAYLLQIEALDCSSETVKRMIKDGGWSTFDESFLNVTLREAVDSVDDDIVTRKLNSVLERNPPRMVFSHEYLGSRVDETIRNFRFQKRHINDLVDKFSNHFSIDKSLWYVWDSKGMALTKIGSHIPITSLDSQVDLKNDKYEQSIRISKPDNTSVPIMADRKSLMSILADYSLYSMRVYVLLSGEDNRKRPEIEQSFSEEMKELTG